MGDTMAPSGTARPVMYAMIGACQMANYVVRQSLPSLIPLIAKSAGFGTSEVALLLASFFPGYLLTQVPAGVLAQKFGAKPLLTVNLAGTAALMLLLPAAARVQRGGAYVLATLFTVLGLIQGSLVPCSSQMQKDWLTDGPERAFALRLMGLGGTVSQLIATAATPVMAGASRHGWQLAPIVYGGAIAVFTVLWQLIAQNKPTCAKSSSDAPDTPPGTLGATAVLAAAKTEEKTQEKEGPAVELGIFGVASAKAVIFAQIASNNAGYTLDLWAPTYFQEVLGCSPVHAGRLIALTAMVRPPTEFVVAAIEGVMMKLHWRTVSIRKACNAIACLGQGLALCCFGRAPSPRAAALCYGVSNFFQSFHGSGYKYVIRRASQPASE